MLSGYKLWTLQQVSQDIPEKPTFRDLFDQQDGSGLSSQWMINSGDWKVCSGQAEQMATNCIASAVSEVALENYIYEISVKWKPNHMGGLYGAYACYMDSLNNVQVLLDVGKRQLIVSYVMNGVKGNSFEVDLGKEFDFKVYHRLRIVKAGSLFKVYMDDILKAKGSYNFKKGSIGMISYFTSVYYDGVELTGHFELEEDNQSELLRYLRLEPKDGNQGNSSWLVRDAALYSENSDTGTEQKVFLTDIFSSSFKASVDISSESVSNQGYFGIYAIYEDEDNYIKTIIHKGSQKVIVECKFNGAIVFQTLIFLTCIP